MSPLLLQHLRKGRCPRGGDCTTTSKFSRLALQLLLQQQQQQDTAARHLGCRPSTAAA
jgi:hypothetical protein